MNFPVLAARGISKRFGATVALAGVDFEVRAGEIHALCGENGAGKSTLIGVLSGRHPAGSYEGEILVDDQPVRFLRVANAQAAGIAVIHQELALVGELSVAENISLGREPTTPSGFIDWLAMHERARELIRRFRIDLDPELPVHRLGVGHQQLVEIVRALGREGRVLILDEPTAALATHEARALMDILRDLRAHGLAIVYISHRLDEVLALADRITVLRDGASVSTTAAGDTDRERLIQAMVGRALGELFPARKREPGQTLLEVRDLTVLDADGDERLRGIDLEVRAGEVLGIGGLLGSGRSELLLHLIGAYGKRAGGSVRVNGEPFARPSPAAAVARGLVLVAEDRKRLGLVPGQSVGFNLSLAALSAFVRHGLIDHEEEWRRDTAMVSDLSIKTPSLATPVDELSGGNQQKVVVGKALMTDPSIVLLDEPTRGIDIGAKRDVYQLIDRLTAAGKAVILVSSELSELIGLSDRIVMLSGGSIGGHFTRAEATEERLLAAALSTQEALR